MKKFILILVVVALLLTGCQSATVDNTPKPEEQVSNPDAQPVGTTPESEPVNNEPSVTPIPDDFLVPVATEAQFTPILYCSGGINHILGGSYHGQWLMPHRFEAKLDGEVVDPNSFDLPINKTLEFALMKKGEVINFYNYDGCMGDGVCEDTSFSIDGYDNEHYEATINVSCGIDIPTIGIPNTTWNPYPLPGQSGGMDGFNHLIDIDKNEVMDTLIVEEKDMDDYKSYTLTLDMEGKRIPITDIVEDGVYLSSRYIYFLDLNGDGRLEIIIAQEGHNLGVSVYDITDGGANEVMYLTIGD